MVMLGRRLVGLGLEAGRLGLVTSSASSSSSLGYGPDQPKKRDPFRVLGLPRNASLRAVKEAYYHLSTKYHPDANKVSL